MKRRSKTPICLAETMKIVLCPDGEDSEDSFDEEEFSKNDFYPSAVLDVDCQGIELENKDENDDDDDIPLSMLYLNMKKKPVTCNIPLWGKSEWVPPEDISWKGKLFIDESLNDLTPLEFFNMIFDENLVRHITEQTNMYALQSKGKELGLHETELKAFLGILMKCGIVKPPTYRYFWNKLSRYDKVADAMTRDRFEEIKSFLHFNDNTKLKPANHPEFDKLFKIRPVIDSIRNNCLKVPQEEHQAVGEQMIPTEAHIPLKQYNPKKAHKWGYKVISRAGESGFVHDFIIYTGKGTIEDTENIGLSSSFVLKLTEDVPKKQNYKVYFDNWFSSLALTSILKDQGILCVSTVRHNRLKGTLFKDTKQLKMEGRGSFDYCVEKVSDCIAIKWHDNKEVHLLSNYAGIEPLDKCSRWDGKLNKKIEIDRPFAINEYNQYMGAVDLSDMFIELYRINFKSRKWYMRIFFYLLDLSVVNAWLLQRRIRRHTQTGKETSLLSFKDDISAAFMTKDSSERGRPSESEKPKESKRRKVGAHPADSTRLDKISHWPEWDSSQHRCRVCVNAHTKVKCSKCDVGLCFTKNRNCFRQYHDK
ncbi:UNVERIFIED_CONTAM: hypothetical protein GTU68_039532 [Idotea baltica]|nr:hypothetical protein [Idotea baltica]